MDSKDFEVILNISERVFKINMFCEWIEKRYRYIGDKDTRYKILNAVSLKYTEINGFVLFSKGTPTNLFIILDYAWKLSSKGKNKQAIINYMRLDYKLNNNYELYKR